MAKGRSECVFCGARLSFYVRLKSGEFCSAAHRESFESEQQRLALSRLDESERMLNAALLSHRQQALSASQTEQRSTVEPVKVGLAAPQEVVPAPLAGRFAYSIEPCSSLGVNTFPGFGPEFRAAELPPMASRVIIGGLERPVSLLPWPVGKCHFRPPNGSVGSPDCRFERFQSLPQFPRLVVPDHPKWALPQAGPGAFPTKYGKLRSLHCPIRTLAPVEPLAQFRFSTAAVGRSTVKLTALGLPPDLAGACPFPPSFGRSPHPPQPLPRPPVAKSEQSNLRTIAPHSASEIAGPAIVQLCGLSTLSCKAAEGGPFVAQAQSANPERFQFRPTIPMLTETPVPVRTTALAGRSLPSDLSPACPFPALFGRTAKKPPIPRVPSCARSDEPDIRASAACFEVKLCGRGLPPRCDIPTHLGKTAEYKPHQARTRTLGSESVRLRLAMPRRTSVAPVTISTSPWNQISIPEAAGICFQLQMPVAVSPPAVAQEPGPFPQPIDVEVEVFGPAVSRGIEVGTRALPSPGLVTVGALPTATIARPYLPPQFLEKRLPITSPFRSESPGVRTLKTQIGLALDCFPADMSRVHTLEASAMDGPWEIALPRDASVLSNEFETSPAPPFPLCPGPLSWTVPAANLLPPPAPEPPTAPAPQDCPDLSSLLALHFAVEAQAPGTEHDWERAGSSFTPFPVRRVEALAEAMPPPRADFDWTEAFQARVPAEGRFRLTLPRLNMRRVLLVAAVVPILVAVAFLFRRQPAVPTVATVNLPAKKSAQWLGGLRHMVAARAGILLFEDFRSGIDDWVGRGGATGTWIFDETGFVQPHRLALYRPSLEMSNYKVEFLGELDRKALSWVFRAQDFRNYHAAKLMIARPGPLPTLVLRHYIVIAGQEMQQKEIAVPLTIRGNLLFQVRMEAVGSGFSVSIGDRLVAHWTDSRLPSGGIGFFSGKGENSRIRWVRIEHQYDVLGRICAYLTPPEPARTIQMGVGK